MPRSLWNFHALQSGMFTYFLRSVGIGHHPGMLARIHVDCCYSAVRRLDERQPKRTIHSKAPGHRVIKIAVLEKRIRGQTYGHRMRG